MSRKSAQCLTKVDLDSPFFSNLVAKDGTLVAKLPENLKYVCLYFSAHWCPPCKRFTPNLVNFYNAHHESKEFEIIFISADRDKKCFQEYFNTMPWLAVDFDAEARDQCMNDYSINSIPRLVVIEVATGEIVCQDGYAKMSTDLAGERFPWGRN
ncbi:hypothetical protein ACOME3_004339 [Neoechinorhynchus agilis]